MSATQGEPDDEPNDGHLATKWLGQDAVTSVHPQAQSPLFRLPPEMRRLIFLIALAETNVDTKPYVPGISESHFNDVSLEQMKDIYTRRLRHRMFDLECPAWLRPGSVCPQTIPLDLLVTLHKFYLVHGPGATSKSSRGPKPALQYIPPPGVEVRNLHLLTQLRYFRYSRLSLQHQLAKVASDIEHLQLTLRPLSAIVPGRWITLFHEPFLVNPYTLSSTSLEDMEFTRKRMARGETLQIATDGWAGAFLDFPALRTLAMEFDHNELQQENLERLAQWSRQWRLPLPGNRVLVSETPPSMRTWRVTPVVSTEPRKSRFRQRRRYLAFATYTGLIAVISDLRRRCYCDLPENQPSAAMVLKYSVPGEHINLQGGWPTPRLHPAAALEQASARLFSGPDIQQLLRYGPGQGVPALRENLAAWLTEEYQPSAGPISPDRVLVTNGASNGLATILQKFADPGYTRTIWMVEPAYHLAAPIFRDAGFAGRIRGVPEGEAGVDFEYLRAALREVERDLVLFGGGPPPGKSPENGYPKIYRHVLYMVPTFSNPSGRTMSLDDRTELVRIAREFDVLLVTDDVYDVLRWCPETDCGCFGTGAHLASPPRLVDVDRLLPGQAPFGHAVSNGSFSKIVAPGVRVGWMEGTPDFAKTLARVGATSSGGNQAHLASLIIGQLLASGDLQRHLRQVLIPTYRARYYAMVAAIRQLLYPLGVRIVGDDGLTGTSTSAQPAGGFFLYVLFPADGTLPHAAEIQRVALEEFNLRIAPGGLFSVADDDGGGASESRMARRPRAFVNGARLCWAWHEEGELVEGIERLAEALKTARSRRTVLPGRCER
ncbi:hypothetical protein JX266_005370 [Neoarthrinium moseri]|nr:hypothetical protein JX266_005370 [Neoarthrinium moseri]